MKGLTRRAVLRRGLIGAALLAAGGGGFLALRSTKLSPLPSTPLQTFDASEYSVLRALARRLLADLPGGDDVSDRVALDIDALLAEVPGRVRRDVTQLLSLVENALPGLLLDGQTLPFTHRSPADQDLTLERWRTSGIALRRTGYQALKRLVLAACYADPGTHRDLGYPGPPRLPG